MNNRIRTEGCREDFLAMVEQLDDAYTFIESKIEAAMELAIDCDTNRCGSSSSSSSSSSSAPALLCDCSFSPDITFEPPCPSFVTKFGALINMVPVFNRGLHYGSYGTCKYILQSLATCCGDAFAYQSHVDSETSARVRIFNQGACPGNFYVYDWSSPNPSAYELEFFAPGFGILTLPFDVDPAYTLEATVRVKDIDGNYLPFDGTAITFSVCDYMFNVTLTNVTPLPAPSIPAPARFELYYYQSTNTWQMRELGDYSNGSFVVAQLDDAFAQCNPEGIWTFYGGGVYTGCSGMNFVVNTEL